MNLDTGKSERCWSTWITASWYPHLEAGSAPRMGITTA